MSPLPALGCLCVPAEVLWGLVTLVFRAISSSGDATLAGGCVGHGEDQHPWKSLLVVSLQVVLVTYSPER